MRASSSSCAVVLMLVLMLVSVWEIQIVKGDLSPSQCDQEKKLLVNACKGVVFGQSPSPSCCQRVKVTRVECICPSVTPKLAALIGVERAISHIEGCGRPVPRNFKCGSVTTPA